MTVVFIPIREVDGVPSSETDALTLHQTLVTLYFLGKADIAAIQDSSQNQWGAARAAKV
jgi:hypothetical protein